MTTAEAANQYRYNSGVSQDYSLASELADYEAEQGCEHGPGADCDCDFLNSMQLLAEDDRWEREGRAEMYATLGLSGY